jgi:hypothetical protein
VLDSSVPVNNECRLPKLNAGFGECGTKIKPDRALLPASVLPWLKGQRGPDLLPALICASVSRTKANCVLRHVGG